MTLYSYGAPVKMKRPSCGALLTFKNNSYVNCKSIHVHHLHTLALLGRIVGSAVLREEEAKEFFYLLIY
jgi:hypothetical protein